MSKKDKDQNTASPKEDKISEIALQLSTALQNLKEELGEKKFEKRIRKAAKLFAGGLKSNHIERPVAKKLPAKKIAAKKTARKTAVKKSAIASAKK